MSDQAILQNNLVSWGSHIFKIDGERWYGLTAFSGGTDKLERAYGYGMNRSHAPVGRSAGKYTPPTPGFTMHVSTYVKFIQYLKSKAPDQRSIGNVEFHLMLQVSEGDIQSDMQWYRCTLAERTPKAEENAEGQTREVVLSCMRYMEDGTTLYNSSEEIR
jgi:hypothetical protein